MIKFLILPRIKRESEFIKVALEGNNNAEKKAAEHLQELLQKHCMPVIIKVSSSSGVEDLAHFVNEYGSHFGNVACEKVKQSKLNSPSNKTLMNNKVVTPTN